MDVRFEGDTAAEEEPVIATTAGSGEGFNTLAAYLFGNNTQDRSMEMTTPVNIDVNTEDGRCEPNVFRQ